LVNLAEKGLGCFLCQSGVNTPLRRLFKFCIVHYLKYTSFILGGMMEQTQKHDAEYYNRRAFTKFFHRQFKEAIIEYSKALYLIGDDAVIYFSRALAHLEINQLDQARADLERAKDLGFPIPKEFINRCM
jgi:tetratricopeptide (TPR) repeat protein